MPPARRCLRLLAVGLVLTACVSASGAVLDAVLDRPAAGGRVPALTVRLAGDSLEVTAVSGPVPPSLIAAVIDLNGLDEAGRALAADVAAALTSPSGDAPAVMVAEVSDRLSIRLGPTPVTAAIAETLAESARSLEPAAPRGGTRKALDDAISQLAAGGGTRTASIEVEALRRRAEAHAASARLAALRRLAAYDQLVRVLAVLPGRKTLLLIGGELDTSPGAGLARHWREAFPELPSRTLDTLAASRDLVTALERLGDRAAAHRIAFYPLASVGEAGTVLAVATGGRVLGAGDLHTAAEPAMEVTFVAEPSAWSSPVELTVASPDGDAVRAAARWGPLDPVEVAADRTLGAAALGLADNPLEISATAQPTRNQDDGTAMVPILVTVPVARLELRPEGDRHLGQVVVLTAVAGSPGIDRREFPVEVPAASYAQAMAARAGFVVGVTLAPGRHLIAVGVCDRHSGSSATTLVPVTIAAAPGAP